VTQSGKPWLRVCARYPRAFAAIGREVLTISISWHGAK